MHNAPLILRIAGLPIGDIDNFSTTLCEKELAQMRQLDARLREVKAQTIELLHERVKDCTAIQRRIYVNLKRDFFNDRSVGKHLTSPHWEEMDAETQASTRTTDRLQKELSAARAAFEARYEVEYAANQRQLIKILGNQSLLNGIALASLSLARQLPRLSEVPPELYRKKERKLELAALRYVSRSGLKLSPYATLTRLALALVKDDLEPRDPNFLPGVWTERSIVRIKRYILEQFTDALLLYEPFKRGLHVILNPTLKETESGKYQFIRPGQWREVPPGIIKYFLDSHVRARLSGPLVECLRDTLPESRYTYKQLKEEVRLRLNGASSPDHLDQAIDELIRIGYLNIRLPWFTNDTFWEQKASQYLKLFNGLDALTAIFEEITSLEESYNSTSEPTACIDKIETLINKGWDHIRNLTGIRNTVNLIKSRKKYVYQDVWIANQHASAQQQELLQLPTPVVSRLMKDITPLMSISVLQWHGYDFLHTVGAFLQRQPKWRGVAPLLDFLVEVNSLWQEYVKYDLAARRPSSIAPFNPLQLEEIQAVHELRQRVRTGFSQCARVINDELCIDREQVEALVREIPSEYIPMHGPCMILQPADSSLERWVLNRVKEGTGRLGSRFVPLMADEVREFYASALTRYGQYDHDGQKVALLDLMCINGDTLNVHPVQTPFVLEMPGSKFDIAEERRLQLAELSVQLLPGKKLPQIFSTRIGRRLMPVHLGGAGHDFLSSEIRFLSMFGPCEMDLLLLPAASEYLQGEITVQRRIISGSIVLKRRRWVVPLEGFPVSLDSGPNHEVFAEVNCWRREHGIPEQVFMELHLPSRKSLTHQKPQFIDFSSPLFVRIFQAALAKTKKFFVLEETLPQSSSYPHAADGSQWAIEFLVDGIISNRPIEDPASSQLCA